MPIEDLYSKRLSRNKKNKQDVYIYDEIPEALRNQIIYILNEAIGKYYIASPYVSVEETPQSTYVWDKIRNIICREKGIFKLHNGGDSKSECLRYVRGADVVDLLDLVELSFKFIDKTIRHWGSITTFDSGIKLSPDEAIKELNERFLEHGVGYQYVDGQIIRIDSKYLHDEVIKPAIKLLHDVSFEGAADEFMKAHEHFRKGDNKETISNALKAFESTLKSICDGKKWNYNPNDTAKKLIETVFNNGLIPNTLQSHFQALISTLVGGLPTIRNKTSGHGQGKEKKEVEDHVAAYALHLAGTNIVFLVDSFKASL